MKSLKIKEEKGMKKKKGFTLIELIAVIAILAILGAVLVPKFMGYSNKAKVSKVQSNARIVLNAIQAYNSDATSEAAKFSDIPSSVINDYMSDASKVNANLKGAEVSKLQDLANVNISSADVSTYGG